VFTVCLHILKTTWSNFAKYFWFISTDVAMVWSSSKYSLWVTGLCALGAKSVIYDCLVTIALCALPSAPCSPPYVIFLAPPMRIGDNCVYEERLRSRLNMTSDFAPEITKYPKSSPKRQIARNSVRAYCLAPLATQLVAVVLTLQQPQHNQSRTDRPAAVHEGLKARQKRNCQKYYA